MCFKLCHLTHYRLVHPADVCEVLMSWQRLPAFLQGTKNVPSAVTAVVAVTTPFAVKVFAPSHPTAAVTITAFFVSGCLCIVNVFDGALHGICLLCSALLSSVTIKCNLNNCVDVVHMDKCLMEVC